MAKDKETAPGGRKSDPMKDEDILDFADEILGTADEEFLELEDVEEVAEEEEDIIDLTDVAGHEAGDEDEEEILDLTDELEEIPDDEIMELGEGAEPSGGEEDILVPPPEAEPSDATAGEDILELDEVAEADEDVAFEVDEEIFDLEDDEDEPGGAGSEGSNFTIEADTIELSEADRKSLEEEFSFEPEPDASPPEEQVLDTDAGFAQRVEEESEEIQLVSEMPEDSDDPWKEPDPESGESAFFDAKRDEEPEEIVLDFGEGPEEEEDGDSAPGEAFFDTFEDADDRGAEERGERSAESGSTEDTPVEDPAADAVADRPEVAETGAAMASSEEIVEISEAGRDREIFAENELTGDGEVDEPAEITIEDDESEEEEDFAWPGAAEEETTGGVRTAEADAADRFEESMFEAQKSTDESFEAGDSSTAGEPQSEIERAAAQEEEVDAPLSTEAMFGGEELPDRESGEDTDMTGPPAGETSADGGMAVHFMNSEVFEEQDMHRTADPISVRVKEPTGRKEDHATEDDLLNRVFDSESESVSPERLEDMVEQAVNRIFAEKIETILVEAIERAVTREIDRLKQLVLGREDSNTDIS